MDEIVEASLLYDFYGEMLTEHQRQVYEDYVLNDLSLGEIAENEGISRQGVHDIVRRCRRQLLGYEQKLHLVEKFERLKENLSQIARCAGEVGEKPDEAEFVREKAEKITGLAESILKEL